MTNNNNTSSLNLNLNYIAFALGFILVSFSSIFTVGEAQTAFVVSFGKVKRVTENAGLHVKIPLIENIVYFDRRINQVDSPAREILSLDQKRLIVDAYTKYKIVSPSIFFQTLKNMKGANEIISSIADSSMRQVVASIPLTTLLSDRRAEIMLNVKSLVEKQTSSFGISIVDVRIMRADLPVENSNSIFSRMRTEREKEARELRSEGNAEAMIVRARADKIAKQIISQATATATINIGEAQGKAAKMYTKTFSIDKEFFNFYQSMESYRKSIQSHNTNAIISTSHPFLSQMSSNNAPKQQQAA